MAAGGASRRQSSPPLLDAITAAYEMIHIATRFGGENEVRIDALHFSQTVLARLSAPSTPDAIIEKAIEKAESGAKVTVADVKDWKAELDAATQRCEEFKQESNERRKTIRTLEEQIDLLTVRERMLQGRLEKADTEPGQRGSWRGPPLGPLVWRVSLAVVALQAKPAATSRVA